MNVLWPLIQWFSGGHHQYMKLVDCMHNDRLWIAITVALDLSVATGYTLIASHWWRNHKPLPDTPAKRALLNMQRIFLICGLVGYLFIPIKMFWPAWRLYDIFLAILAYLTWRYAWSARDLKVVYNELGKSQRLVADLAHSRADARRKSYFLGAVSHDLRTPLNGLMLHAELAQMSLAGDDHATLGQAIAQIKQSAREAAQLLDHFLEIGRLDWHDHDNQPIVFSLRALIGQVIQSCQTFASHKGLYLRSDVGEEMAILSDPAKLERIVLNLVHNGLKFTQRGGVSVAAERLGDDVAIHVVDSGEGIATEHHEHLFDEFFQVHNSERNRAKGFGLGLAVARRLAEQLGGRLAVSSAIGRGSRFTLRLPGAWRAGVEPADGAAAVSIAERA